MRAYRTRSNIKYLMPDEQRIFLKNIHRLNIYQQMNVLFPFYTGARVGEMLEMRIEDIHNFQSAYIPTLKQNRKKIHSELPLREVPLAKEFKPLCQQYLDTLNILHGPLFQYRHRFCKNPLQGPLHTLSYRGLQENIKRYMKMLNLDLSIHSLRHTFAMNLVWKNVPVTVISKLLGHANLETTMIYLEPSRKDLYDAIFGKQIQDAFN